jgi:hypothetical protein
MAEPELAASSADPARTLPLIMAVVPFAVVEGVVGDFAAPQAETANAVASVATVSMNLCTETPVARDGHDPILSNTGAQCLMLNKSSSYI